VIISLNPTCDTLMQRILKPRETKPTCRRNEIQNISIFILAKIKMCSRLCSGGRGTTPEHCNIVLYGGCAGRI
jgi:hypothetical protein